MLVGDGIQKDLEGHGLSAPALGEDFLSDPAIIKTPAGGMLLYALPEPNMWMKSRERGRKNRSHEDADLGKVRGHQRRKAQADPDTTRETGAKNPSGSPAGSATIRAGQKEPLGGDPSCKATSHGNPPWEMSREAGYKEKEPCGGEADPTGVRPSLLAKATTS